jgi:hypothetical protein
MVSLQYTCAGSKGMEPTYPSQKLSKRPSWIATTTNITNRINESVNIATATPSEQYVSAVLVFKLIDLSLELRSRGWIGSRL